MKYGIDIGHNSAPDIGASGIRKEDIMTMEVGTKVMAKLKALGHQVIDCKPSRSWSVGSSLRQRCNIANANRVDRFVSIHFNAFNGTANGVEVFGVSSAGKTIAKPVLDSIVDLGYFNRGVKDGSHLYVLRNTNMPAIIVECCFCDSQKDMDLYNAEALANAIVKGLTGEMPKPPEMEETKTVLELQKALNQLKIPDPDGNPLTEDGIIGEKTKGATKQFQNIVGLTQTAIAGPTTWGVIDEILAKPILRENHAGGTIVKYLQHRVGTEVDGVFGPGTAAAVVAFQRQQNITADGIVGPQTWDKLFA